MRIGAGTVMRIGAGTLTFGAGTLTPYMCACRSRLWGRPSGQYERGRGRVVPSRGRVVRGGATTDIVGEVIMDVVATGESCRTVSVDWPWPRVPDDFANNINNFDALQEAWQYGR